ncbi:ankyrin repeat-containing domain protein [Baffinella frigidus]|nr:ankyrin repeat-containing domain protein [Cryptophyta sp. CCMP2293]
MGVDVNGINGQIQPACSALHAACKRGQVAMVQLLLEAGADANLQTYAGDTPLHWTAQKGHAAIARSLIAAGALVNIKTHDSFTALIFAAAHSHYETVQLLLGQGADVSVRTNTGQTALHFAAQGGDPTIVQMLLDKGADPHAETDDDDTPIDLASNEHVKEVLLRAVMRPPCCAALRLLWASMGGWARSTRVKLARPVARSTPSGPPAHSLETDPVEAVATPKTCTVKICSLEAPVAKPTAGTPMVVRVPSKDTKMVVGTISAVLGFPDPATFSDTPHTPKVCSRPPVSVETPTVGPPETPTVGPPETPLPSGLPGHYPQTPPPPCHTAATRSVGKTPSVRGARPTRSLSVGNASLVVPAVPGTPVETRSMGTMMTPRGIGPPLEPTAPTSAEAGVTSGEAGLSPDRPRAFIPAPLPKIHKPWEVAQTRSGGRFPMSEVESAPSLGPQ